MNKVYAIIGTGPETKLILAMHQAAFKAENLEAQINLVDLKTDKPEKLANFCYETDMKGIGGVSVCHPFQTTVMDFLDYYDPIAKKVGAANTLKNEEMNLNGYNTQVTGIVQAIQEKASIAGKKALILGAGERAEQAAYGLKEFGADVYLWNRSKKKVDGLAEALEVETINFRDIKDAKLDLILNATPVGTGQLEGQSLLTPEQISEQAVVIEMNLGAETPLLKNAKIAGAQTVSGERILLHQTAGQFEVWFDKTAPIEAMEKVLNQN